MLAAWFLAACSSTKQTYEYVGNKINPNKPLNVEQALNKFSKGPLQTVEGISNETKQGIPVKIEAKVSAVCQSKGCWMTLENPNGKPVFVRFKDYGFFMPLDLAGKTVVLEGNMYEDVTPVDELRHYAEDKGASEAEIAAITEPKREMKVYATGVAIPSK